MDIRTSALWIIEGFGHWPLIKGILQSSPFDACLDEMKQFTMILSPSRANTHYSDNYLDLRIETDVKHYFRSPVSVTVSLINSEFHQVNQKRELLNNPFQGRIFSFPEFVKVCTLINGGNQMLCNHDLIILCEIAIDEPRYKVLNPGGPQCNLRYKVLNSSRPECILSKNMELILKQGHFTDFQVHVQDKCFFCHKFVLACRSEYFARMFRYEVRETIENKLVLTDVEPVIFEKILYYIYTGRLNVIDEEQIFELVIASDRFGLDELTAMCVEKLHSFLCPKTAMEMFHFASFYNLQELKVNASLIINVHLLKKNPKLILKEFHESSAREDSDSVARSAAASKQLSSNDTESNDNSAREDAVACEISGSADFQNENSCEDSFFPKIDFMCLSSCNTLAESTWCIKDFRNKNFDICPKLSSHSITCREATWEIQVGTYLSWEKKDKWRLLLSLKLTSQGEGDHLIDPIFKLSILTVENKEKIILMSWPHRKSGNRSWFSGSVSIPEILASNSLLHDCDLLLHCCFMARKPPICHRMTNVVPVCDLQRNILSVLKDKIFPDVFIKVLDETVFCHKAILAYYFPSLRSELQKSNSLIEMLGFWNVGPFALKRALTALYLGASGLFNLILLERKNPSLFFSRPTLFDFSDSSKKRKRV